MFDFQPRLEEGLATLGLEASVDQVDQLMRFAGLLQKWNKVYNLTAIRRDDEILTHHLLDSAALVPFVKRLGGERARRRQRRRPAVDPACHSQA